MAGSDDHISATRMAVGRNFPLSVTKDATKDHSITATINLFWFFEKETIQVNDPSPVYEGSGSQFSVK